MRRHGAGTTCMPRPGNESGEGTGASPRGEAEDTATPLTCPVPSRRPVLVLVLLCTANFMVILDSQVVVLALPSIERDLGFARGGSQWVLSAYLLSFGGLLLLGGRAADLLGRRRVFLAGTALFLLMSLACGLAWTGAVLVAARVLQGVAAAMMSPSALSILMTTFDEGPRRNRALAAWSGVGGFGATAALLVGGSLIDGLGWEWIFFLNVPIAGALLVVGPRVLAERRDRDSGAHASDPLGAVTVTAGLALGVYAIVNAPQVGWGSPRTLLPLAASAVLLMLFAVTERRVASPLVPPRTFRSRGMTGGNLVILLAAMAVFGTSFTVSQYAQRVLGYSPLLFGVASAVLPMMAVAGAYGGQAAVTRLGARRVGVAGMLLLGAGCLALARVPVDGHYARDLLGGLAAFGLGLGACSIAGPVAALGGVAPHESGLASGINASAFQIGGAVGVAVLSTAAVSRTGGAVGPAALTAGFRVAFAVAALFALVGLAASLILLPGSRRERGERGERRERRRVARARGAVRERAEHVEVGAPRLSAGQNHG